MHLALLQLVLLMTGLSPPLHALSPPPRAHSTLPPQAAGAHQVRAQARMIGAAAELAKLEGAPKPEDQTAAAAHAQKMQAALFNVMAVDIESTVGRAAMLCLHDSSVTKEVRPY